MPLNSGAKNVMLEALADVVTHMSLHTASPLDIGANEIAGGSPAYARKAIVWAAATGGQLLIANVPVFDIPEDITVTHFGLWSGSVGGTFYGGGPLTTAETYSEQGTFTVSESTIVL